MESISCALCILPAMVLFPAGISRRLLGKRCKSKASWMPFSPFLTNRPNCFHARMLAILVAVGRCRAMTRMQDVPRRRCHLSIRLGRLVGQFGAPLGCLQPGYASGTSSRSREYRFASAALKAATSLRSRLYIRRLSRRSGRITFPLEGSRPKSDSMARCFGPTQIAVALTRSDNTHSGEGA